MGMRNQKKETLARLTAKTLEAGFLNEIREGLGCSPFEAEAVLEVVREVFFPFLDENATQTPPGRITLTVVAAEEPAGKPVADCQKQNVCLILHRGPEDDMLMHELGPAGFRRARIPDLCQEALSQGGLLTADDLAYRVFFVTPRTITRDLNALRKDDPSRVIPLRSTVHDIGPVLTHRSRIIRLALEGKTTSQICQIMRHSPRAVSNYVSTFVRCAQLADRDLEISQIAFLLKRGKGLVRSYLELLGECRQDKNMAYHLEELLRLGCCGGEKKDGEGR